MTRSFVRDVLTRSPIIVVLLVLVAMVAGCSAVRFGYNRVPELLFWQMDGYADFDEAQSRLVRERLGEWHAWHRRTQLPDYAALLGRARGEALRDTTPERVCAWWAELRVRAGSALDEALPAAAEVIVTLTPAQVAHVERRFAKANAEFREEYLDADAARRRERAIHRVLERAEYFYGALDSAQRERVEATVSASAFDAQAGYEERLQRQQATLQLLHRFAGMRSDRDAVLAALRVWSQHQMRSPRDAYRRDQEALERYNCGLVATLHNLSTPAQRQAAAKRLEGWEIDARALSAQGD